MKTEFTPAQVQHILDNLYKLPLHEQAETLALLEELNSRKKAEEARHSLLAFAHLVAPVLQIDERSGGLRCPHREIVLHRQQRWLWLSVADLSRHADQEHQLRAVHGMPAHLHAG